MKRITTLVSVLAVGGAAAAGFAVATSKDSSASAAAKFRIEKLSAVFVKGEARLTARVCTPDPSRDWPDTVRIEHSMTSDSGRWVARVTIDHAPLLVPFGESWNGKSCGPARFVDPVPATHFGAESLGNPCQTYAVQLALSVGKLKASKRAVVRRADPQACG